MSGAGPLPGPEVEDAVRHVLAGEDRDAVLSVAFLPPDEMRHLNRRFKGHDHVTDVLAFALPQPDGTLAGDIYVCPEHAGDEAAAHGVPLREELLRLLVHGTLHILGWDHPDTDARERSPMWERQERYVRELA